MKQSSFLRNGKHKAPLVSIVTSVFNGVSTIEQMIKSVIEQTYSNIEHIIIDGNSTDGTSEVIAKYKDQIAYYERQNDEGIYHGMNRGIAAAKGDYILLLNSDDYYLPETVQTLVEYREATGTDIVGAQVVDLDAKGAIVGKSNYRQYNSTTLLGMVFCHNLMLVPKRLYQQLGYHDVSLEILADWDFSNRLWRSGVTCSIMRETLMCMRNTGQSMTKWEDRIANVRRILRNEFPFLTSETLSDIADPRVFSTESCKRLLSQYAHQSEFCKIVYDYGVRRSLICAGADGIDNPRARSDLLLSIIIPCYNCSATISRALESALRVSRFSAEIICINDGSKDKTLKILKDYEEKYPNLRVIDLKYNAGVSAARNEGINQAAGEYIFFMDADDLVYADGVAAAIETALSDNADVVIGSYNVNTNGNISKGAQLPSNEKIKGVRFNEISNHFFPQTYPREQSLRMVGEGFYSCLYKAELVKSYKFQEKLAYGEDSLFLIVFLCQAKRISWISNRTYEIVRTEGSAMARVSEERAVDTAQWRLWASRVLLANRTNDLARFVSIEYWNPAYAEMLKSAVRSRSSATEILTIVKEMAALFNEKPSFLTDEIEAWLENKSKQRPRRPQKKLRVNIIIGTDSGGAANGSIRRMNALRSLGHDVRLYTAIKNTSNENVYELAGLDNKREVFRDKVIFDIARTTDCSSAELFSNIGSCVNLNDNKHVLDCDIVHLHWITGLYNFNNFSLLRHKPIVWTLADINPLTGGCHYSEGCTEFMGTCNPCHFFKKTPEFAAPLWQKKKEMYAQLENVTIVCPSKWMADQVKKSSLLGGREIRVIPNAMPTDVFTPQNKLVARIKLGLPTDKKIILFGADNTSNKRKGGDILKRALDIIAEAGEADYFVATFGSHNMEVPFPSRQFGLVNDPSILALIYSAADIFVFPSREDNAPLTVGEALLCGTPVVSTNVGYVPEILVEGKNGLVSPDFRPDTLAGQIVQATQLFTSTEDVIGQQAKVSTLARQFNDPTLAAKRHVELYEEILSQQPSS